MSTGSGVYFNLVCRTRTIQLYAKEGEAGTAWIAALTRATSAVAAFEKAGGGTKRNMIRLAPLVADVPGGSVSSLAALGEAMYLGRSDGAVLRYGTKAGDGGGKAAHLTQMTDLASKKPVQQLFVLPEPPCVVAMCDGVVSCHDLVSLEQQGPPVTSGAHLLCIGRGSSEGKICVATKKKIHLYGYEGGMWREERDFAVPDKALTMEWHDKSIAIGYKQEYCMLDTATGDAQDVFPIDPKQLPMLCPLTGTDELIFRLDKMGVFLTWQVTASPEGRQIDWGAAPLSVAHCYPFVVALFKDCIQVHSLFDTTVPVQMIEFKGGLSILPVPESPHPMLVVVCSTKVMALEVIPPRYRTQIPP